MKIKYIAVFISTLLISGTATATDAPTGMNYVGRILAPGDVPLETASVDFTLQIRSPLPGGCLLFEETHNLNMTASDGYFELVIGKGTPTVNDEGLNLNQVLANSGTISSLTCDDAGTSYTPVSGDTRDIRVQFDDGVEIVTIAPDHTLNSVPYSLYAQTLQGLGKDDYVQVSGNVTQAKLDALAAQDAALVSLADGSSTAYVKPGTAPAANLDFAGTRTIINLIDPSSAQDAATKNYSDTKLIGKTLPATPTVGENGQSLRWDNAGDVWEFFTPSGSGTVTDVTVNAPLSVATSTTTPDLTLNIADGLQVNGSNQLELNVSTSFGFTSGELRIASGGVGSAQIDDGSIAEADIADGAVGLAKLKDQAVGQDGQSIRWNNTGTAWEFYSPPSDTNTTYSADGQGIEVSSEVFSLELNGTTLAKSASGLSVNSITNSEVSASADIDRSKLADGSPNRMIINNGSGAMIDAPAITGNRALASDASGLPVATAVTDTELGYLDGVTSAIQTQLGAKVASAGGTMSGDLTVNATTKSNNYLETAQSNVNVSGAATLAAVSGGNIYRITLTDNGTITLPAPSAVANSTTQIVVKIAQDATGSRTLAWAGGGGNTIKWSTSSEPAVCGAANEESVYQFFLFQGDTTWYGTQVWKECT